MRRVGTIVAVLLVVLTVAPQSRAAGGGSGSDSRRIELARKILDRFNQRLADVYNDLQKNTERSNRRARRHCEKLIGDYMDALHDNSFAPRFFGYTLLFRAIAEYRLGRERDAIWYWQMAQDVLPELMNKKFGNFADAEEFLLQHRIVPRKGGEERHEIRDPSEAEKLGFQVPEKIDTPPPKFPRAANASGFSGSVEVECTIGVDGKTSNPRLSRSSGVTTADMSALLALKDWRFKPALEYGIPTVSTWHLTVHFERRNH